VDDTRFLVQVLQRLGHLDDGVAGQVLGEVRQTDDLVEQFASGAQLKHNVVVLPRLGKVDELDDVGVV
jgi:hypothetical protein